MRIILAVLLLVSLQAQAGMVVYTNMKALHPQWVTMMEDDTCQAGLWEDEAEYPDDPMLVLWLVNHYLHNSFVYTDDGITDHWCSNRDEHRSGLNWDGDCDNFALTAAAELRTHGFPGNALMPASVLTWAQKSADMRDLPDLHPLVTRANHMILLVYAKDEWWVLDNRSKDIKRANDVLGKGLFDYTPYTITTLAHHDSYWRKWWWEEE